MSDNAVPLCVPRVGLRLHGRFKKNREPPYLQNELASSNSCSPQGEEGAVAEQAPGPDQEEAALKEAASF